MAKQIAALLGAVLMVVVALVALKAQTGDGFATIGGSKATQEARYLLTMDETETVGWIRSYTTPKASNDAAAPAAFSTIVEVQSPLDGPFGAWLVETNDGKSTARDLKIYVYGAANKLTSRVDLYGVQMSAFQIPPLQINAKVPVPMKLHFDMDRFVEVKKPNPPSFNLPSPEAVWTSTGFDVNSEMFGNLEVWSIEQPAAASFGASPSAPQIKVIRLTVGVAAQDPFVDWAYASSSDTTAPQDTLDVALAATGVTWDTHFVLKGVEVVSIVDDTGSPSPVTGLRPFVVEVSVESLGLKLPAWHV